MALQVKRLGRGPRLPFCDGSGTTIASTRRPLKSWAEPYELLGFDDRSLGASATVRQPDGMAHLVHALNAPCPDGGGA